MLKNDGKVGITQQFFCFTDFEANLVAPHTQWIDGMFKKPNAIPCCLLWGQRNCSTHIHPSFNTTLGKRTNLYMHRYFIFWVRIISKKSTHLLNVIKLVAYGHCFSHSSRCDIILCSFSVLSLLYLHLICSNLCSFSM